jgi:general secretion pathway protein F
MPTFQYKALTAEGKTVVGRLEAGDRSGILKQLKDQGLIPVEVGDSVGSSESSAAAKTAAKAKRKYKIKIADLVMFTHQMNSVLRANIPLTQALTIIGSQAESDDLREALRDIRESIEGGASLAEAMREFPGIFPPIYVNTVRMGETGGVLDQVMEQLADFMESSYALRSEVSTAMYYPAAIIMMAVLSVTFILYAIVPRMTEMFLDSGIQLPLPTRILIGAGNIVTHQGWLILLILIGGFIGFRYWLTTEEGRYQWFRFLRAVPGLGVFIKKVGVARIAQTMSSLLQSGVPALDGLRMVSNTVSDAVVQRALKEACEKVQKGQGIAKPLAQTGVFPSLFVQMISVGEESGELEEMFSQVSAAYNLEVRYAIKKFTSLMEPLIILVMAVVVLGIVLSLALPMMEISKLAK